MRHLIIPTLTLSAICLTACSPKNDYQSIEGQTMGTSYHITFQGGDQDPAIIQQTIDARLQAVNQSMSTYMPDSTISQFNRLPSGQNIVIDGDFAQVLQDSQHIYQASQHAFDPTVYPLVELWGFGSKMNVERLQAPPSEDSIASTKQLVGLDKVQLSQIGSNYQLQKSADGVGLDFSAIAKGYAVDVIANTLKNNYGVVNYMVEIGGEVATSGQNAQGKAWTLGIDTPTIDSTIENRQTITTISQPKDGTLHIATSGGYRNSLVYNGVRYSHTINPVSGKPVAGNAPSVTVLHDSVALADGWATALTAIPYQEALTLANANQIKAIFVVENADKSGFDIVKTQALTN